AKADAAGLGSEGYAESRSTNARLALEGAAAKHALVFWLVALLAVRILGRRHGIKRPVVAVGTPLPDVAVHVIQPPGIGSIGADAGRSIVSRPGDPRLLPGQVVAGAICGLGAGSAGIFPLGLGRQAIATASRLFLGQRRKPFTELHRVFPGDVIYG